MVKANEKRIIARNTHQLSAPQVFEGKPLTTVRDTTESVLPSYETECETDTARNLLVFKGLMT